MSKYLVYVLVPYSVPYGDIQAYVAAKLEPYRITGGRWGWFDYLCRIEGREPFSDSDTEHRIPHRVRAALQGYICDIGKAQDAEQPLVLVTLDGEWHGGEVSYDTYRHRESSEFEEAARVARETWQHRYASALRASPPCWVLATWAHS